jgi:hypothetical protein
MSDDLEEELRDEVKNELEMDFEKAFGGRDTLLQDDEFDIDASDTELEKQQMEFYMREFNAMNDNERLHSLAIKTQELYKRAKAFDDQMITLNRQYKFLDKSLNYEEGRVTQDMIPTQNQNYGVGTPSSK